MKPDFLAAASLGLEIALAVFLGAGLGYWFDKILKTGPWGMVIGLVIGSIAGLWNAVKLALNDK